MKTTLLSVLLSLLAVVPASAPLHGGDPEPGFVSLFNGRDLAGWRTIRQRNQGWLVRDGLLICPEGEGAKLLTEKEYSDFILRFEFKLRPGGNNGVGVRVPIDGHASIDGMEIQILDNTAPKYAGIRPYQAHGSVYGLIPARRGALAPVGEWNRQEIALLGRRVKVTLNGTVIVSASLNDIRDAEALQRHPGVMRSRGHVGLLGHSTHVEFRNLRIKDLGGEQPDNLAPEGFQALFNGMDLEGWKGLVANPKQRAAMDPAELAAAQREADVKMREHWRVEEGVLIFDGKGDSLCSRQDFRDFELWVDWKIEPDGDSGIYLRGSPQIQIWADPEGSGAMWNNKKNPSQPKLAADHPVGEWNRFRILMTGEKVTVWLNHRLVVHNTVMENYWERDRPIYPTGSVELQAHGNPLYFKNVYVRRID